MDERETLKRQHHLALVAQIIILIMLLPAASHPRSLLLWSFEYSAVIENCLLSHSSLIALFNLLLHLQVGWALKGPLFVWLIENIKHRPQRMDVDCDTRWIKFAHSHKYLHSIS